MDELKLTSHHIPSSADHPPARLTGEKIGVVGSSRTDAGVHAYGLCAHFDSATRVPPEKICFALNTMLPPDIRIRDSMLAPEGFHARFSTCGKVYRYTFCNARHACAIGRQYKAHAPMPMDEELMCKEAHYRGHVDGGRHGQTRAGLHRARDFNRRPLAAGTDRACLRTGADARAL